jgi:hypothetical protein
MNWRLTEMSGTAPYNQKDYTTPSPSQGRETPAARSLNPLASSFFLWRWIKYFYFLLILIIIPYFYYDFLGDSTFSAIMFLLYFVVVYNEWFAARMADRKFILWRIPGIRSLIATTVDGFAKLRDYYAGRPPVGWFRSFFSVFLLPFNAEVRREWKLFNGLLAFGMVFVILETAGWGWEYFTVYSPELTAGTLIENKLIIIIISVLVTLTLVIPTIRTLTYIELAGEVSKGRWLILLALAGVLAFPLLSSTENYPYENYLRLQKRLWSSELFAKKFDPFVKEFIQQHYQPQQFSVRVTDDGQKPVEFQLKTSRLALTTSIQLTRLLRQQLVSRNIVFRSEVNGIRVLAFDSLTNGEWRPGLLIYASYGVGETGIERTDENNKKYNELDWHILKTQSGVSRRQFIALGELDLLYRVLLGRMQGMGEGDQLSPDFKGTTP